MSKEDELNTRPMSEILSEIDPNYNKETIDLPIRHTMKSWPMYFRPMRRGRKNFDVRKKEEGRHFDIGQYILLREWSPALEEYSGEWDIYHVQYVLHGEMLGPFGIENFNADVIGVIHVIGSEKFPDPFPLV